METISNEIRVGVMSMPHVHNESFMSNGYEVLEDDHPAEDEFDLPIDEDSPRPNSSKENNVGDFLASDSSTNNNHSKPNRIFQPDRYANLRVHFPNDDQLSPSTIQKVIREQKQALGLQLKELEAIENTQNALTGQHQVNGASKQLLLGSTWEQKLQPYLNTEGGIADSQYLPKLMQLLAEEKNSIVLLMFAKAVLRSDPKAQKRFVDSKGLKWLRTWLHSSDTKLVVTSLELFAILPMTEEQLKASHLEETITDLLSNTSIANQAAKAFKKIAAVKSPARSPAKQPATPTKVTKPPTKLTPLNDSIFGGEEPNQPAKPVPPKGLQKRIAPDYIKPRKHKMQVVDLEETTGKEFVEESVQKKKLPSGSEKPLSADAIKKAKLKEKYLDNAPHTASPPMPVSPPIEPASSSITPATQSPPLSTPHETPSNHPMTTISSASGYPIEPPLKKQRLPPSVAVPSLPIPPAPSPVPEPAPVSSTGEEDAVWNVAANAPPEEEIPFEPPTPYSKKTGKLKKKVTWVADEKLESCKYFFKEAAPNADDSLTPTSDAAPIPLHQMTHAEFEKHRLEEAKRERADRSAAGVKKVIPQPTVRWRVPPPMDMPGSDRRARGEESKQAAIQTDRETKVLNLFFMDDSKTPNTPSEPDAKQDEYDDSRVKLINPRDDKDQHRPGAHPYQQYQPHPQQQQSRQASSPTPSIDSNALNSLFSHLQSSGLRPPQMQTPPMQQQPTIQPQMSPPMQQLQQLQAQLQPQMQAQLQQQLQQMQQLLQQPGQLQQLQPQQIQQFQQQLQQMQGMNLLGQVNPTMLGMQVQQAQQLQMLQQQQQLQALQALQQQQQQQQLFQMTANQPGVFQGLNMNALQQLQQLPPQQLQQLQQQLQLQQLGPALQNINPMLLNSLLQNQQSGQPPQSFPQQQQPQHRYRS